MAEIIKTWPIAVSAKVTARIFSELQPSFGTCFFTLGRGKPHQEISRLWFTYQGRILGSFSVAQVWRNDGSLPPLRRLDGGESEWQLKPDAWIAITKGPCRRLRERVFMSGFRGWRYFSFDQHRASLDSRMRI